jgi:hypothetical protein
MDKELEALGQGKRAQEIQVLLQSFETKKLQEDRPVVSIPEGRVIFVGDLHNDPSAVHIIETSFPEVLEGKTGLVGLGDYGLTPFLRMLGLWRLSSDRTILLRGNHEEDNLSLAAEDYFFRLQLELNLGEQVAGELFDVFRRVFAKMPVAAVSPNRDLVAIHDPSTLAGLEIGKPSMVIAGHDHFQKGYSHDQAAGILTLCSTFQGSVEEGRVVDSRVRQIGIARLDPGADLPLVVYRFNRQGEQVGMVPIEF